MQNIRNKILANEMQQDIKSLTYHDTASFISGLQECFNTFNSINVIHDVYKMKDKILGGKTYVVYIG